MPARWPAIRGNRRFFAQRPLPSMITAIWRGRRSKSIWARKRASARSVFTASLTGGEIFGYQDQTLTQRHSRRKPTALPAAFVCCWDVGIAGFYSPRSFHFELCSTRGALLLTLFEPGRCCRRGALARKPRALLELDSLWIR